LARSLFCATHHRDVGAARSPRRRALTTAPAHPPDDSRALRGVCEGQRATCEAISPAAAVQPLVPLAVDSRLNGVRPHHPVVAHARSECQREPQQSVAWPPRGATLSGSPASALRPRMFRSALPGMSAGSAQRIQRNAPSRVTRTNLMPVVLGDRLALCPRTVMTRFDHDAHVPRAATVSTSASPQMDPCSRWAVTAKAWPAPRTNRRATRRPLGASPGY